MKLFWSQQPFASENGLITPTNKNLYWAFGLVAGAWLICLLISGVIYLTEAMTNKTNRQVKTEQLSQFKSESEFRHYLAQSQQMRPPMMMGVGAADGVMKTMPAELNFTDENASEARYSTSNVQVVGIDEPDIVKTDGKNIFVSAEPEYYLMREAPIVDTNVVGAPDIGIVPPVDRSIRPTTDVITAVPIAAMKKLTSIEANGKLLVTNDRLVVLENQAILGFDISKIDQPERKWKHELESNRQIEAARLINNRIVIVSKARVYPQSPCPISLWKTDYETLTIPCTQIWRPNVQVTTDGVYTVSVIDPSDGSVKNSVSFVGGQNSTIVYVSPQAIYIGFTTSKTYAEIQAKVLLDQNNPLIDEATKKRIAKVMELDISQAAKEVEINEILSNYTNSLNDDERMKWEAEMSNQLEAYANEHKREIEETIITKISLNNWQIATGEVVPGRLLNQFSMDEYDGYLRVATNVGGFMGGSLNRANDVYVLDNNLKIVGKVLNLGQGERIYAVRFMEDRGFVVTFRETDPLYALDMSDPATPKVSGELKIPGYSSYLHPLKKHLLVGVGKQDTQVKVSLFDVSNADNPTEIDKYTLPDYWTDILSTHLAFLHDEKQEVFFVPASSGGYIFSYKDNKLTLAKTVADATIRRAVYINYYLYLVGTKKITVIGENDWTTAQVFEW